MAHRPDAIRAIQFRAHAAFALWAQTVSVRMSVHLRAQTVRSSAPLSLAPSISLKWGCEILMGWHVSRETLNPKSKNPGGRVSARLLWPFSAEGFCHHAK